MEYIIKIMRASGAYSIVKCPTMTIFIKELEEMLQTRGRGWRTNVTELIETEESVEVTIGVTHTKGVTVDAE